MPNAWRALRAAAAFPVTSIRASRSGGSGPAGAIGTTENARERHAAIRRPGERRAHTLCPTAGGVGEITFASINVSGYGSRRSPGRLVERFGCHPGLGADPEPVVLTRLSLPLH